MNSNPYLSIIIIGRNDDYMKGGFDRMKMSINNFAAQAKKYNFDAELIIVDWNPPEEKPLLKDTLLLPDDLGPLKIRFIVVPGRVHKSYKSSPKVNIINMAAFNVGIRRAKGEFILATNSDIMFSDELMHFVSLQKLQKNYFYRAFRYDVDRNVLKIDSYQKRMDFCKNNVVKAFEETIAVHPKEFIRHPVLQTYCGGDFILFSKEYWEKINGYPETNNIGLASDVLLCYMVYLAGLKEKLLEKSTMRVYHIDHDSRWRGSESKLNKVLRNNIYNQLKEDSKLKALVKKANMVKRKICELFCGAFYQIILILKNVIPKRSFNLNTNYLIFEHRKTLYQMLRGKRSYIFNNENWGFPKENFQEFFVNYGRNKN